MNVGFSAFHEGQGAGKSTAPGGHIIVNEREIVTRKEGLEESMRIQFFSCYRANVEPKEEE